jgi:hypothetical protein
MSPIEADVVAEGRRLLDRAEAEGVALRLLGGVAIVLRSPDGLPPALRRDYGDLDFATERGGAGEATRFFRTDGYEPHVAFNALHGKDRLLFFDLEHDRQVDVFVGEFRMSHKIPFDRRVALEGGTVPLAELLLTKLQIAKLNEKDVRDTLGVLHGHAVGESDGDTVNAARIAEVCCSDWGLWRTFTGNLALCAEHLDRYDLSDDDRTTLRERIEAVAERIELEPKSRSWRLRARVGERVRWYEEPEEVGEGP